MSYSTKKQLENQLSESFVRVATGILISTPQFSRLKTMFLVQVM